VASDKSTRSRLKIGELVNWQIGKLPRPAVGTQWNTAWVAPRCLYGTP